MKCTDVSVAMHSTIIRTKRKASTARTQIEPRKVVPHLGTQTEARKSTRKRIKVRKNVFLLGLLSHFVSFCVIQVAQVLFLTIMKVIATARKRFEAFELSISPFEVSQVFFAFEQVFFAFSMS